MRRISDNTHTPVTLIGIVIHELTYVLKLANIQALLHTADTDTNAYADIVLAQARSATGSEKVRVLRFYVAKLTARHVHWVLKELSRTLGNMAIQTLPAEQLAAVVLFYFVEFPNVYDTKGYDAGVNDKGKVM